MRQADQSLASRAAHACHKAYRTSQATPWRIRSFFFKIFFILLLDSREGREKERERDINVWLPLMLPLLGTWSKTQTCVLTGNQTGDPLVHRLGLNPLSYMSQGLDLTSKGQAHVLVSTQGWSRKGPHQCLLHSGRNPL